jgi:hypothetical protein
VLLTFETIHHKQHGSLELGPNNRYLVVFTGPKEVLLQMFTGSEKEDDSRPPSAEARPPLAASQTLLAVTRS